MDQWRKSVIIKVLKMIGIPSTYHPKKEATMKTLQTHYDELMSLYLDQLISTGWQSDVLQQRIKAQHMMVRRREQRMLKQPQQLQESVAYMLSLIDNQLALTLPVTKRMTSYRNSAQHEDYDRMLAFRTALLHEKTRINGLCATFSDSVQKAA